MQAGEIIIIKIFIPKARITAYISGVALISVLSLLYMHGLVWGRKVYHQDVPHHIVSYSFVLQNRANHKIDEVKFLIRAPVKLSATQHCTHVRGSHPFEITADDYGNQTLECFFAQFPPYGTKILNITAELKCSSTGNISMPGDQIRLFLKSERFVESQAPEIVSQAKKLRRKDDKETAKTIFNYVSGHIHYVGFLKNERGALYALRNKKGDCTEYMDLFAALCRADGIPVRRIAGYVIRGGGLLKPSSFHNWAEFYVGGKWWLADPKEKIFMTRSCKHIATQIIYPSDKEKGTFAKFWVSRKEIRAHMTH